MRIDPGAFGAGKSQICQLPDWTRIETNGESGYVLQQALARREFLRSNIGDPWAKLRMDQILNVILRLEGQRFCASTSMLKGVHRSRQTFK